MTNQSTIDKLIEMRLTTMADAFRNQLADPKFREVPFEDRFGMLVDIEYSNRKNNRLKRLIHNAGFDQPEANIIDINYTSGRKLNKDLNVICLFTNEYIFVRIISRSTSFKTTGTKNSPICDSKLIFPHSCFSLFCIIYSFNSSIFPTNPLLK
mgnify:CR=1 FL=1